MASADGALDNRGVAGQRGLSVQQVADMIEYRRNHGAPPHSTTGQHVCVWCAAECQSYSTLRAHMRQPNCSTAGSAFAAYLTQLGVRRFFTCDGCGDTAMKTASYRCACHERGLAPQWREHGGRAPNPGHAAQDAQRQRQQRLGAAARPAGGGPVQSGGDTAPADPVQPQEVVRLFTAVYAAPIQYDTVMQELWLILEFFAGDEAQLVPRADHNVDAEFLALMGEFNEAVDGVQALRQRLPEPACAKRGALLQAQAAVAMLILPGLARRMQHSRGWRTPAQMKALLAGVHLAQEIHMHGRAAVILDYFVRPFVNAHPRDPSQGGASTIKPETLRHLVREGKLSKAIQLARAKYDAEVRGLATTARPTKAQIERTVREKFPEPRAGADAIPTHEQLPPQDWRNGEVDWGQGSAEERAERSACFGGKSVQLRLDSLKGVLAGLSKQKAAGVDTITNVFLRRVFKDGNAPMVEAVLLPFASMCLAGTVHPDAMAILLAGRLALIPKVDDSQPVPTGVAAQPLDFRPLGIGGAIMRLISTAMCSQEGSEVGKLMSPLQLAVRISDGTCTIAATAQATFTHGRTRAGCCDILKTDIKNAYGTVLRTAILRGLRKYAPGLIRWFIISYGGPTRLFHSTHGFVGWVREGVKQGDPMATILFSVALQESIIQINEHVRDMHGGEPTARAWAFADDIDLHGDGLRLLDSVEHYKSIIRDLTGMELCLPKCTLLVSSGNATAAVRTKAGELGITVVTEGTVVMGVPVGTDEYIADALTAHVGGLLLDIAALDYFTLHGQWTLLRMCVNQRPVYLQRLLQLRHGEAAFSRFDRAVTAKVLDIMGVLLQDERELVLERVDALRCLPLQLSGGAVRAIARASTRVKALYLCRDNIARFFAAHAVSEGQMGAIMRAQWGAEQLPVVSIEEAVVPAPPTDDGVASLALRGHVLGSVPDDSVQVGHISGDPDTDAATRPTAKRLATDRALTADLVLHSRTLRGMRDSEYQYNKFLAAHVLSSSCANSGVVVQSVPTVDRQVPDARFRQILRLRFGVPCVMPLGQWRCNCTGQGGPRHGTWTERIVEGNVDDQQARASFAEEPLHGLYCRRRWMRVTYRHDSIRDALWNALKRIPGVQATLEPRVTTPLGSGDQRRADIKVHLGGTTWLVDVGVVCPGTPRLLVAGTAETPGRAAALYSSIKAAKYRDQSNFVPFIVETGGRINAAGLEFFDTVSGALESDVAPVRAARRAALYGVANALIRQQGYMLAQIVAEIHAPDHAVGEVSGEGEAVIVEGVGLSGYRAEEDAVFSAAGD